MNRAARLAHLAHVEATVADMLDSIRSSPGPGPGTSPEDPEPDTLTDRQADRIYAADADFAAAAMFG